MLRPRCSRRSSTPRQASSQPCCPDVPRSQSVVISASPASSAGKTETSKSRTSTPHLPRSNEGAGRTWTRRSSRRTRSWSPSAREDLPQPELLALRQVHEAAVQREWQGVQPPRRRDDRDVPAPEVVPGLPDEGRASATTSTSSTSSSPAAATRRRRSGGWTTPRSSTT